MCTWLQIHKATRFLGLLLLIVVVGLSRSIGSPDVISSNYPYCLKEGTYHLIVRLKNNHLIEVSIQVVPHRVRFPNDPKMSVRWGTDGGIPETLIGHLNVKINGNETSLALPDYDYLGNPISLTAFQENDTYVVKVTGGDAGGSYNATWSFSYSKVLKEYLLRKRLIQMGEFPEVHESTEYTYDESPL